MLDRVLKPGTDAIQGRPQLLPQACTLSWWVTPPSTSDTTKMF